MVTSRDEAGLGTLAEGMAYQALTRLGKQPGRDFEFQPSFMGGRPDLGGVTVNFWFTDPPGLAIKVEGPFSTSERASALMVRQSLLGRGITLVYVDEVDLMVDPAFYLREALAFRDHSTLGRGS